jgi:hypothetical protein
MCDELDVIYANRWKEEVFPPDLLGATLEFSGELWMGGLCCTVYVPTIDQEAVAGWRVTRMPALAVIHDAWVAYLMQGKGIGKFLSKFRVESFKAMKQNNRDAIEQICHASERNEIQQHILREVGWEQLSSNIWRVK